MKAMREHPARIRNAAGGLQLKAVRRMIERLEEAIGPRAD
jgi:hypothetical protein